MGLDTVELLMDVEKHFDIEISNKEAEEIGTVGEFRDCVCKKLSAAGKPSGPVQGFEEIKQILLKYVGPKQEFTADSHIVNDLGLD